MKGCCKSLPRGPDLQEKRWDYFKVHSMDPNNLFYSPARSDNTLFIWTDTQAPECQQQWALLIPRIASNTAECHKRTETAGPLGISVPLLMRQWGQNKHTLERSLTALHVTQDHSWDQLRWDRTWLRTSGFQKGTRLLRSRLGLMYGQHLVISQSTQTFPLPAG